MTVSSTNNKSGPYTGNGVTTVFARTFLVTTEAMLKVYQTVDGVTSEVTTGITKDGIGSVSGDVTFSTAPETGVEITLIREVNLTQESDYSNQGTVPPENIEDDLDLQVMQMQDLAEQQLRVPKIPVTETSIGEIPALADRAGYFYAWDVNGDPMAVAGVPDAPVSVFMATVLDDATAAAARTTLGAMGLTGDETIAGHKIFGAVGDATLTIRAASSGAAADDDAILALDATEGGQGTVMFKHDDTALGYIYAINGGNMRVVNLTGGVELYHANTLAAVLEAAGTGVSSDQAIITKEKGDARYDKISYSDQTISSGQITYAGESLIFVQTEGGAASDDLNVTTGAAPGNRLTLALFTAGNIVTVKDGVVGPGLAGFKLAGGVDFTFINATDTISFILVGANWHETSRSIND